MAIFEKYAQFYDTLYQDKDYKGECDFIEKIFKKYSNYKVKTILDLGCGTASHDIILAKRNYDITGVDISQKMLKIATEKIKHEDLKIELYRGNIQTIRLHKKLDAVISMFNVMGYQTTNETFKKALLTAKAHLKKGGLFIFDIWFGPAVLQNKPKNKIKNVYNIKGNKIIRHSKCKIDTLKRIAQVYFTTKKYSEGKLITTSNEQHNVRFFFLNEIRLLLTNSGFNIKIAPKFLKRWNNITDNNWETMVICEKT